MRSLAGKDLRNCSFRKQLLNGADFSGADLRGCNFAGAQLVGANFEQAKMGPTLRQRLIWSGTAIATFLLVGQAISNLVAGSLGQTPTDKAWNFVLVLVLALAIAGGGAALRSRLPAMFQPVAVWLSAIAVGAVVGFYYAGVLAEKNPTWAIAGGVMGGLMMMVGCTRRWGIISQICWRLSCALSAYGFAFLMGATAFACLNVGYLLPGVLLGVLTVGSLWWTWQGLLATAQTIQQAPGTSFREANLTEAKFSWPCPYADFTNAVGRELTPQP
ncbi:MAG: pentapeptide repeat-containing protein [Leptolyngbyaceae cyanobacterium bins.349]|nr:pentapeptide repeat-containing protein [Leptolyngbyaceae cyanobacterium bins.349]